MIDRIGVESAFLSGLPCPKLREINKSLVVTRKQRVRRSFGKPLQGVWIFFIAPIGGWNTNYDGYIEQCLKMHKSHGLPFPLHRISVPPALARTIVAAVGRAVITNPINLLSLGKDDL